MRGLSRAITFALMALGFALLSSSLPGCDPGKVILKAGYTSPMGTLHQEAAR